MSTTAIQDRIAVSTISFRHRTLTQALTAIAGLGAVEVDLGAIPAVTDHVPVPFTGAVGDHLDALARHGLRCGAINADVGDLNDPGTDDAALREATRSLLDLAAATGSALVLACGSGSAVPHVDHESDLDLIAARLRRLSATCAARGVRLLVEAPHHLRYVRSTGRAEELLQRVDHDACGLVLDVSHVVASGEDPVAWAERCAARVERVHLRDAVPGDLNIGIGRGAVDFPAVLGALERSGFRGSYVLELETHDVAERDRESDARRSLELIRSILRGDA